METFSESFPYKRVVVTGGAGFLGRFIVERLRVFSDVEVFVPRRADYNLVEAADIKRSGALHHGSGNAERTAGRQQRFDIDGLFEWLQAEHRST